MYGSVLVPNIFNIKQLGLVNIITFLFLVFVGFDVLFCLDVTIICLCFMQFLFVVIIWLECIWWKFKALYEHA
jgi:hypothetical protein